MDRCPNCRTPLHETCGTCEHGNIHPQETSQYCMNPNSDRGFILNSMPACPVWEPIKDKIKGEMNE